MSGPERIVIDHGSQPLVEFMREKYGIEKRSVSMTRSEWMTASEMLRLRWPELKAEGWYKDSELRLHGFDRAWMAMACDREARDSALRPTARQLIDRLVRLRDYARFEWEKRVAADPENSPIEPGHVAKPPFGEMVTPPWPPLRSAAPPVRSDPESRRSEWDDIL